MRLLRCKNGGGLADETSEFCAFSSISRDSRLMDKSSVWSSSVKSSVIGNSTLTAAIVENSTIQSSRITGGQIVDSYICAELVADYAVVKNSALTGGNCRIAHTAYLENVSIENLTVTGDARLINWAGHFDGQGGYISRGIWERPPRILYLASGLTITESVSGFCFCGCKEFSIAHWLKVGDRYGKKLGLTSEEVQQIREFLHTL